MLCLPPIPFDYENAVVVCGIVIVTKRYESAGRSFFERFELIVDSEEETNESCDSSSGDDDYENGDAEHVKFNKKKEQFSGNALRLSQLVRDENLYEILQVSESCSLDEVRKSYRRLVLEKHPDKIGNDVAPSERKKLEAQFLKIQESFEVLSDERTRRMYESGRSCDDTIPSERDVEKSGDFFSVFGPAFDRNARWSVKRPVPSLGTMDSQSTRKSVESFYQFWFNFSSWRDFSHHDEFDLNTAESRDEKRWMVVQNGKARKKRYQEEVSRIRKLVDLAYKLDPRIRKFKQDEIQAALDEKQRRQDEIAARIREEEERKIQLALDAEIAKEKAKEDKLKIKKTRAGIRQVLGCLDSEKFNNALIALLVTVELADECMARAEIAAANSTVSEFVNEVIDAAFPMKIDRSSSSTPSLARTNSVRVVETSPVPLAPTVSIEKASPIDTWTPEELQLLTRGMQKYPVGTNRRWEVIQGLIPSRTVTEIVEVSKIVKSTKVPQAVSDEIKTKNVVVAATAAPDVNYEKLNENVWTQEQQKQLEEAIKKTPTSLSPAERWSQIADLVEGKNKQECVARFKYIRELLASKK